MTQVPSDSPDPADAAGDGTGDGARKHSRRQKLFPRFVGSQRVKWLTGVVLTAVIGAVTAALITPDLLRGSGGPSASPTTTTLSYKRVARADGAIAFEVPSTWGAVRSDYDDPPGHTLGPGLTAGVDPTAPLASYQLGRAFVGASAEKAKRVQASMASKGVEAVLHDLLAAVDWKIDGCAFNSERVIHREDGVIGVIREWRDCDQRTDVLYDGFFAPADGNYIASVQASFPDYSSRAVADRIIDTFRVTPEALVIAKTTGERVIP